MALSDMIVTAQAHGTALLGAGGWMFVWTMIKILCVLLPLMGLVAYATLWERKLIGWIQIRVGPNRVGPAGLLQPIADAIKLLFKEIVVPAKASKATWKKVFSFMVYPFLVRGRMREIDPQSLNQIRRQCNQKVLRQTLIGQSALAAPQGLSAAPGPDSIASAPCGSHDPRSAWRYHWRGCRR